MFLTDSRSRASPVSGHAQLICKYKKNVCTAKYIVINIARYIEKNKFRRQKCGISGF